MGRRILSAIAAAVGITLALALVMHMLITPVSPRQEAPDGHVQTACWACHFISDSAKLID